MHAVGPRPAHVAAPLLLAGLTLLALVFSHALASRGLTGPSLRYAAVSALGFLPMIVGAAALRAVVALVRRRLRPAPAAAPALDRGALGAWAWDLAWIVAAQAVLTTVYTCTKLYLPAFGGGLWDGHLAAADRALALGVDPNVFMITIFSGAPRWAAWVVDFNYSKFVLTMLAGTAWFLTDPVRSRRLRFAWGAAAIWSVGLCLYVAMPALGPAFAMAGLAGEVGRVFPASARAQATLLVNYRHVLDVLAGPGTPVLVVPEMGIAAMPSLHVALHAFLALWAVRTSSLLRTPLFVIALLTFIGSVATGWHYAVDSWAGLVLAVVCFVAASHRMARETRA